MIACITADELARFLNVFSGIKINVVFSDKVYIKFKKMLPVSVVIVPQAQNHLLVEIDSVKLGGINITAIARKHIFPMIAKYSNDFVAFSQSDRSISVSIKGFLFSKVEIGNNELCLGIINEKISYT